MTQSAGGHYGALPIPTAARAPGEAVTDRALTVVGGYLRAFLNAYAVEAWRSVDPSNPPVKRFYTHDPREGGLNERDFPSLYLFRTGGDPPERISEEWRMTSDQILVLWVFPREGTHAVAQLRRPFVAGLAKLLDRALWLGRDASFVAEGDPDPAAAERGSDVFRLGGLVDLTPGGRWEIATINIDADGAGGGEGATYHAIAYPLTARELDAPGLLLPGGAIDPAADGAGGASPFDAPFGVNVRITTPDAQRVIAEYQDDPLP